MLPNSAKTVFLILMALLLGCWALVQSVKVWQYSQFPWVEGTVVETRSVDWWRIFDREMLMIQVRGSDYLVFARVNNFVKPFDPENVKFRYGGDPTREVFLDCEENPLPIFLVCFGSSIILGLFVIFRGRLKRALFADFLQISGPGDGELP